MPEARTYLMRFTHNTVNSRFFSGVQGVNLETLERWDRGFESYSRHCCRLFGPFCNMLLCTCMILATPESAMKYLKGIIISRVFLNWNRPQIVIGEKTGRWETSVGKLPVSVRQNTFSL